MVKSREDNSAEIAVAFSARASARSWCAGFFDVGRAENLGRLVANFLAENRYMRRVLERLGFRIAPGAAGMLVPVLDL